MVGPDRPLDRNRALEIEKDELRQLIKFFHPDAVTQAIPADRERALNISKMLNALSEIHERKKLISENGWPKDTPAPREIPLIAFASDGMRLGVNFSFGNTPATPRQYFDEVKKYHKNPAAYHADVVARNRAEKERRETEKTRHEAAERLAREAQERAAQERQQRETERESLKKIITERFGLVFDPSFERLSRTYGTQGVGDMDNLRKIASALGEVGAPISLLRGFSLHVMHFGETKVESLGKLLQVNIAQKPEDISANIIQGINVIQRWREARAVMKTAKPFNFHERQFANDAPDKIIAYVHRIQEAISRAEHGWILKSGFVHQIWVSRSRIDDMHVRYKVEKTDPKNKSAVSFEIGINADLAVLTKAMDEIGIELEKFYPATALAPHKVPLIAEHLQAIYGIRFSLESNGSKVLTPERKLRFLEHFHAAYEKIPQNERHWLQNMTIMSPNEGARLLGREIGSRKAWVFKNQFFAHYDASEATVLETLLAEIKKKKDA